VAFILVRRKKKNIRFDRWSRVLITVGVSYVACALSSLLVMLAIVVVLYFSFNDLLLTLLARVVWSWVLVLFVSKKKWVLVLLPLVWDAFRCGSTL